MTARDLYWKLMARLRPLYWPVRRRVLRARRAWFVIRVRVVSALRGAAVRLEIAPDVELGRRVVVSVDTGTQNKLVLGPGTCLDDDVRLWLRGGTIIIGPRTELRCRAWMNSSGQLEIGEDAMIGHSSSLHCARSLTIGNFTVVAERTTITDSRHLRTPLDVPLLHHVVVAPTAIGVGVWIGAGCVVASGVTVGDGAFVGGGSVVIADVPAHHLAAGNPARTIRPLDEERPE